jgi:hypothetical protein
VRWCEHPFELPVFAIRQYWHARFHRDAACAWLRRLVAREFAGAADGSASVRARVPGA